jgi:hypothetical protein
MPIGDAPNVPKHLIIDVMHIKRRCVLLTERIKTSEGSKTGCQVNIIEISFVSRDDAKICLAM